MTLLGYKAVAHIGDKVIEGLVVDESEKVVTIRTKDGSLERLIKTACERLVVELSDGTKVSTRGCRLLGMPAERLKKYRRGWEKSS
ncbi:MAG: ribonuclease P protein subunit [Thaumarchaeota archaeon]|nr:ribonuclease P protein subunit [Candidatus Calditenuaceae archaeon]MDW8186777.1 hypothetical protein [Nitrososphaerota archaeon]